MTLFFFIISISYVLLIGALLYGWTKIPYSRLKKLPGSTGFSVIIPYRNEAENLQALFDSLGKLAYPKTKFEIFFVNDGSRDGSQELCLLFKQQNPDIRINLLENFRLTGSPKKDAIATAIQRATFEYIITTDGDCEVPEFWLQCFNETICETGALLIAGPVMLSSFDYPSRSLRHEKSMKYFKAFQEMDFLSLQVAGAGSFGLHKGFMCSGANLCYKKSAFFKVDGFFGNGVIASGDDVFLLQKFVEHKLKTVFIKSREAIILTKPQSDLSTLIAQRIRWSAKTPAYTSWFAKITGIIVLVMNFSLVIGCSLAMLELVSYKPVIMGFLFKFLIDLLILYRAAKFFDSIEVLRHYFWASILYPLFSTTVVLMSLFRRFEWKGRKYTQ